MCVKYDGLRPNLKHHKSRVAYHTGDNSPTFQLLNDSAVQLILSGDINPNPGPVQNPCSVCKKAVAKNHRALSCDGCGLWCHIGRKCAGISVKAYKEYQQMEKLSWLCPLCSNLERNVNTVPVNNNQGSEMAPETLLSGRSSPYTFNMPKGFNLFHLNVRRLFPKIDEIRLFANENPFHVLAFSETWLTSNISDSEISIAGYLNPLRCDWKYGNNIGGGIAAYLKTSVPHKEIIKRQSQSKFLLPTLLPSSLQLYTGLIVNVLLIPA